MPTVQEARERAEGLRQQATRKEAELVRYQRDLEALQSLKDEAKSWDEIADFLEAKENEGAKKGRKKAAGDAD